MEEVEVPSYYVLNRKLPDTEADAGWRALGITPVAAAIVSDLRDSSLAFHFAPSVQHVDNDQDALTLAGQLSAEVGRPLLVIGEADFIDAVYPSGRREALAKHE